MSKGKKRREAAERRAAAGQLGSKSLQSVGDSFFGDLYGQLEPVTDELVNELLQRGVGADVISMAREMGLSYSRKRKSFTSGGSVELD